MALIIAIVVIVVGVLLWAWIQDQLERVRIRRLQTQAEELNLKPSEEGEGRVLAESAYFLLFSQGATGSVDRPLAGELETASGRVDAIVFEYTFTRPMGRYTRAWRQTVVLFRSDSLSLPDFTTMPEITFEQMAENAHTKELREQLMGSAGVRLRDYPSFSREFHIHAGDRRAVRDLYNDELVAFHEAQPALCVEGHNHILLCYRFDEMAGPAEIHDFVQTALQAYDLYREAGLIEDEADAGSHNADEDQKPPSHQGETL